MNLAWLAAGIAVGFGVLGPGIGVGILTAKSSEAMGRNPDAAAVIRTNMIIGAALAEGLGILAFVLGILLSGNIRTGSSCRSSSSSSSSICSAGSSGGRSCER
ncbi:MAG: ATP synthase F0 subunit C [Chloroflexi bacterium]|nr:MAG: ATP synthase F0 subunit C [Chloroflexota bacterium]